MEKFLFKTLIITLLSTISSFTCYAQKQDTVIYYYKSNGKRTEKISKAMYSEQIIKEKNKILITKKSLPTGNIIKKEELKSLEPYIENGLSTYFDKNSHSCIAKGYYKNGILDSTWIYKTTDNKYDTVSYSGISLSGVQTSNGNAFLIVEKMPLIGNFEDLIKKREKLDLELMKLSGDNNSNNAKYLLLQKQIMDINHTAFTRFQKENLKYPARAKEKGIKGKVYVKFIINSVGKTAGIEILNGVDKDLDMEAIRLIKTLPVYYPGKQKGNPVNVVITDSVNF